VRASSRPRSVPRHRAPSAQAFHDELVLGDRPAIITGVASRWPAVARWSHAYLRKHVGDARVDVGPRRDHGTLRADRELAEVELATLLEQISSGDDRALSYARQFALLDLPRLAADVRPLPYFDPRHAVTQAWVGPAGTVTHLHWDPAHNLFAQIRGRKRVILVAPADAARAAPNRFPTHRLRAQLGRRPRLCAQLRAVEAGRPASRATLAALLAEHLDRKQVRFLFNVLAGVNSHDIDVEVDNRATRQIPRWEAVLEPGELLFIPFMWRHQVRSLEPSVSLNWFYPAREKARDEIDATLLDTLSLHIVCDGMA